MDLDFNRDAITRDIVESTDSALSVIARKRSDWHNHENLKSFMYAHKKLKAPRDESMPKGSSILTLDEKISYLSGAFEIRFAVFLINKDIQFEYECLGEGAKTIDFRFNFMDQIFNVELHRLSTSQSEIDNTRIEKYEGLELYVFDGGDYSNTQGRQNNVIINNLINCQRTARDKSKKFKMKDSELNVLFFDVRSMNSGGVDWHDAMQIFDARFVQSELRHHVREGEDFVRFKGVFEPDNKIEGASFVRNKTHIGLAIHSDKYGVDEFKMENIAACVNGNLVSDDSLKSVVKQLFS
jgi:hypothetical protein